MEWNGRKRAPKIKAHSRRVRVRTTLRVQGDGPDLEKEEDRKDDANRTADKNERGRREHLHTGAASRGELSCSRLATFLHILHVVTWNCVARPLSCCATTARNFGSALRLCYTAAFAHRNRQCAMLRMERAGPPFPLRPLCSAYRAVARGKRGIGKAGRQLDIHVQLDLACTVTNISTLQPPRSRHRAATRGRRGRISPTVNPSAYTGEDCAAAHTSRHKATAATCRCHGHARRQRHRSTCSGGGGGVIINRGAAQRRL